MGSRQILVFGHRGAAGEAPENTLPGFNFAWNSGIRCFETDIRMTGDGELVLLHDANLLRTTGREGTVDHFSFADLASLNACRGFSGWLDKAGIPSLHQVLDAYHEKIIHWQLEIKSDTIPRMTRIASKLWAEIDHFNLYNRVTVTSFDPKAIQLTKERYPELACGLIAEFRRPQDLYKAIELGCQNVCLPLMSSSEEVAFVAKKLGLKTTGWLGNDFSQLETLLTWQVDSITTDFPSIALPFLAQTIELE